jgi:hypothetical protein
MGKSDNQDQFVGWMDLRTLAKYACVCEKTLRSWIRAAENPLPASQPGKAKLYVHRDVYDKWLRGHAVTGGDSFDKLVNEMVAEVRT